MLEAEVTDLEERFAASTASLGMSSTTCLQPKHMQVSISFIQNVNNDAC